jgi:4-deoxy-L-threo-5-hexosulose-uronate ketol-isomerase
MRIEKRWAPTPDEAKGFDTEALRRAFHVGDLFRAGEISLVATHLDRLIVGGVVPDGTPLTLSAAAPTGTPGFLDRREMAVVNIGADGGVTVGGTRHPLAHRDVIYIGMGAGSVSFDSDDGAAPARFYLVSAPAHRTCPTVLIPQSSAKRVDLGTPETSNQRSIFQFVHPAVCDSCQLVFGYTMLATGSVWNTMPAHVHDRRSEAYLYFALPEAARVFHFMGEPGETRHLVLKNEEGALSPGWSIHCGAGTSNYTFVWAMAGDNVDYTDVDPVPMEALR